MTERSLRIVALAIALLAAIDPSWNRERPVPALVSLHVGHGAEDLAEHVRRAVGDDFVLTDGPTVGAAARIVVDGRLPAAAEVPTFAVVADVGVEVVDVSAPAVASADARVPVRVLLRLIDPSVGDAAIARLFVNGLVADERPVVEFTPAAEGLVVANMRFTPAGTEPHHVRLVVGDRHLDTLVSVGVAPWRVLAYDPRPSWGATFVRRAIESDPRFTLAARIETSTQSGVVSGDPAELADMGGLGEVDVIVVGAPDALDADTVRVLRDFLRRRGGSVVTLIDREPGPVAELARLADWNERISPSVALLRDEAAEPVLRASEVAVPGLLPAAGRALAGVGTAPDFEPVVWRMPVGSGRLIVSGALDAWRYRGADERGFDRFWRDVVAEAAAAAAAPLEVEPDFRVGRPGQPLPFDVMLRDLALDPANTGSARVSAQLEGEDGAIDVRLWPADIGRFRGVAPLSTAPGAYRLVVEGDGARVVTDLQVRDDASNAVLPARERVEAWAAAQGGAVVSAAGVEELTELLRDAITTESTRVVVHPMRNAWWMVPFALALGGEWWLRRRRGRR